MYSMHIHELSQFAYFITVVWHSTVTNVFFIFLPPILYARAQSKLSRMIYETLFIWIKGGYTRGTQCYYYDVDCISKSEDKNNIFRRLIKFYRIRYKMCYGRPFFLRDCVNIVFSLHDLLSVEIDKKRTLYRME